ncbi:MAG: hypothetical protein HC927_09135 [Deltaproteobacteria bacterium]|nr:hypothetical protein [Deltaproteobacteria bacterium]
MTIAAVAALAGSANGAFDSAHRLNSTVRFLTDLPGVQQVEWTVDGQSQLALQDFYISINGGSVVALSSFSTIGVQVIGSDTLSVAYIDAGLGVQASVVYTLSGSAGQLSDLEINIQIDNISNGVMDIEFFQFVDFDLGGTVADQSVNALGIPVNNVRQNDFGVSVSEAVTAPPPSSWQVGEASSVLAAVLAGSLDGTTSSGAGDLGWAISWERTLNRFGSLIITKDLQLTVPTPGAAGLLAIAGLAATRRRR